MKERSNAPFGIECSFYIYCIYICTACNVNANKEQTIWA